MGAFRVEMPTEMSGADAPVVNKDLSDKPQAKEPVKPVTPEAAVRPEWCPEKFWDGKQVNQEALAKSYAELEKKKPAPEQPKADEKKPEDKKPDAKKPEEKKEGEQTPPAQVIPGVTAESQQKFTEELQKEGKLSDASYEELQKAGYPKQMVDAYIAGINGQKSTAEAQIKEIKGIAGGDEGYSAMTGWAAANLSAEEVAAYDKVMNGGDTKAMDLAARGLHSKYTEATGKDPALLGGNSNGGNVVTDVFKSTAEVTRAMRDPKYKTDEAYRQAVSEKLARSSF